MTLVEFLKARLDDKEQAAKLVPQPYRLYVSDEGRLAEPMEDDEGRYVQWGDGEYRMPNHINNWELVYDPADALADVEAKRRILARLEYRLSMQDDRATDPRDWDDLTRHYWETVCDLASVYASHPDYKETWKPR